MTIPLLPLLSEGKVECSPASVAGRHEGMTEDA